MNFPNQGFENPNLIEPMLAHIYESASSRGICGPELSLLKEKIGAAFEKGIAEPDAALIALERLFAEGDTSLAWLLSGERMLLLLQFFGYCEFLKSHALKHPEQLQAAMEQAEAGRLSRDQIFAALETRIAGASSLADLKRGLRVFKNEQYLRLGLANLACPDRLAEEVAEVSHIAEAALELGLKYLLKLCRDKKIAGLTGLTDGAPICVLGMGKLGSEELNFSSDIDLIYLCGDLKNLSDAESERQLAKYSQLAELLTKLLSEITEDGFIFRTDLRLRPGGENGPLVIPCGSAVDYYHNFGRNWERAAFLRARPVAGDIELGKQFLAELQPFVFRRAHDFASLEDLKDLKERIDQEARKQAGEDGFAGYDLKLGPGGIREVEFFVQALQLIYGGKYPELRTSSTMTALAELTRLQLVKAKDAGTLKKSWSWLRRLEHRVQLKGLRQDHRVPKNKHGQEVLARSFGYIGLGGLAEFQKELKNATTAVEKIFNGLFGEAAEEHESKFAKFVSWNAEPEDLEPDFEKMGFEEPDLAAETWLRILAPLQRAERAPKMLAEVLPILLEEIVATPEPDLALRQLERFLSKTGARAGYLSLLKDHPAVRKLLIDLFAASEFLGNLLISHPELLDELVSPHAKGLRSASELEAEIESYLEPAGDYEERLARLRLFQKMELLRIGMEEMSTGLEQRQLEERLTTLAEIILEQSYKVSWTELTDQFGRPARDEQGEQASMLILGLGKLGSREMSWASDLDLIFIYSGSGRTDGKRPIEVHEFFVRLSQKIISTLQSQTAQGFLYHIDTRLRPSGTHGPLIVSVESFEDYHRNESQVWEKQALIKARVLVDGAGMRDLVTQQIERGIYFGNRPEVLREEMRKLLGRVKSELARENENLYDIKFGYGGEMEIEYITQYLQLVNGESQPRLRVGNSWLALERLAELEIIAEPEYLNLREALWFFRRLSSRMRIYQDRPEHQVRLDEKILDRLAKKTGEAEIESGEKLRDRLSEARKNVHQALVKYIGE